MALNSIAGETTACYGNAFGRYTSQCRLAFPNVLLMCIAYYHDSNCFWSATALGAKGR